MSSDLFCSYCLRARAVTGRLVASPLATICESCARRAVELFDSAPAESVEVSGPALPWSQLSDEELLQRLPDVAAAGRQVEEHLATWVAAARERGVSWAKIGNALGMTRQSAWERFSST